MRSVEKERLEMLSSMGVVVCNTKKLTTLKCFLVPDYTDTSSLRLAESNEQNVGRTLF